MNEEQVVADRSSSNSITVSQFPGLFRAMTFFETWIGKMQGYQSSPSGTMDSMYEVQFALQKNMLAKQVALHMNQGMQLEFTAVILGMRCYPLVVLFI